jgi:predicted DNA-binding transcriptional regulator AlpA
MAQFLSPKDTCRKTAVSRATLDRLVASGEFPKPVKLTERRLAYEEAKVEQWMAEKLAAA